MFYEGINTKVFRRSITFVIALVVTSLSSSFEYTMSVHASAERNVCNTVVSIHFKYILAGRQDLILTSVALICAKGWAKGCGDLGGEDLEWDRGKCASLYTRSSDWAGMVVVWGVSVDTTILHTYLSAPACTACTDIVYSKELERDVTTSAMAKAILRLKTLVFISS